jgi:hypothetical protein
MLPPPSLPYLPSVSLPEVVWVAASAIAMAMAMRAWARWPQPRARLKNLLRTIASAAALGCGLISAATPPATNPTWLSVITPMTIAFVTVAMALLSVIDEQAVTA